MSMADTMEKLGLMAKAAARPKRTEEKPEQVYLGIVRIESSNPNDRTWIDVDAEKLSGTLRYFQGLCPPEVRATCSVKVIPVTMHENSGYMHDNTPAYLGINGYRDMTAAEIDARAAKDKSDVAERQAWAEQTERAEYERLRAKFSA